MSNIIRGSEQSDILLGTQGADEMLGLGGDDRLSGGRGRDHLDGGIGNDTLRGGRGRDTLNGGPGNDRVWGGQGNDRILGSAGNDQIDGGAGRDTITYSKGVTLEYRIAFDRPSPPPEPARVLAGVGIAKNNGVFEENPGGLLPFSALADQRDGDILKGIETIVGATNRNNSINFSRANFRRGRIPTSPPTTVAPPITVDLSQKRLRYDQTTLRVKNFANVLGSFGNDRITGDRGRNVLNGYGGSDRLSGKGGDDLLIANEGDTLVGGRGRDDFKFLGAAVQRSFSGPSTPRFRTLEDNRVLDFKSGRDRLLFENSRAGDPSSGINQGDVTESYLAFVDLPDGQIGAEQFAIAGQDPITERARFIYNQQTGELFFRGLETPRFVSPNASFEQLPEQLKIVTLQGAPTLQASDLVIV